MVLSFLVESSDGPPHWCTAKGRFIILHNKNVALCHATSVEIELLSIQALAFVTQRRVFTMICLYATQHNSGACIIIIINQP